MMATSFSTMLSLAACFPAVAQEPPKTDVATALKDYYALMTAPKPFHVCRDAEFAAHRRQLRQEVLRCMGLWPLPERIPLDIHQSEALDGPWCTVRRVYYQLWPRVYGSGLLFMPKELPDKPAPTVLCPHGHWKDGNAHPVVQTRCLVLAGTGYVVFSPTQNHYEDLNRGISHQTIGVWNSMRALDYLESLPQVDTKRIGVCGCSGGGLQAQMILALDDRITAAVIAGYTCESREIMFSTARAHCGCNHFPTYMRFTDHPEISALGLPAPVCYLTMNDWTVNFLKRNFPTIQELYAVNGFPDRVVCSYESTAHNYDRTKRELTYWWLDRWLRGAENPGPAAEPDQVATFPQQRLLALSAAVPENVGFKGVSDFYRSTHAYAVPRIATKEDWQRYRERMVQKLRDVIGDNAALPRSSAPVKEPTVEIDDGLVTERCEVPSEGPIRIPAVVLRPAATDAKLPVVLFCDAAGKEKLLRERGPGSPVEQARNGALVVLPDIRFCGVFSPEKLARQNIGPWHRNAIVWGRPLAGMGCTDLRSVVDAVVRRPSVDTSQVKLVARNGGLLACAALFAAALDNRIVSLDADLKDACFEKGNLPAVPFVLQHGDVLQWAALLADRTVMLRNVPKEAGNTGWLAKIFATVGNRKGLEVR